MIITESKFNNNKAITESGGAIESSLSQGIQVSLSSFYNNSANQNGGAINSLDVPFSRISSSFFINNNALAKGGGINVDNGEVIAVSFTNNNADQGIQLFSFVIFLIDY